MYANLYSYELLYITFLGKHLIMVGITSNIYQINDKYSHQKANFYNARFLAHNREINSGNKANKNEKYALIGINFLLPYGLIALIHKKIIFKSLKLNIVAAALSAIYAFAHDSMYIKTPGSLIISAINKLQNPQKTDK